MIYSTVKRFLGISAPFKMDPEAEYLTQQMDPVKGGQVTHFILLKSAKLIYLNKRF
jgi:hypothetical protein